MLYGIAITLHALAAFLACTFFTGALVHAARCGRNELMTCFE